MSRKAKFPIVIFCCLAILLFLWWLFAINYDQHIGVVPSGLKTSLPVAHVSNSQSSSAGPSSFPHRNPLPQMLSKETRSMWRTPIVFYGRVVDENLLPVIRAKVVYDANTLDETLTKEGHVQGTVYSDANGLFLVTGIKSRFLGLQLSHPDYYNSEKNRDAISYAGDRDPNIPDTPEKAWVFRMYKKRTPAAGLVNSEGGGHGRMDGSPFSVNLGKYAQITAEGTWSKPRPWDGKPFDWALRLFIPDGGIMECKDEVTFDAPTTGYQPEIWVRMSKDGRNWKTDLQKSFYFKSANLFGRIDVFLSTYHDLYLSVHYVINPTGSTNLESGHGSLITTP